MLSIRLSELPHWGGYSVQPSLQQIAELKLLLKEKCIDDDCYSKIIGMISSEDEDMMSLGKLTLDQYWLKRINSIIKTNKDETIRLLWLSR